MRLDVVRTEMGITQENMANRLNIATTTYCQYENGKRMIPRDIAEKVAKILCCPVEEIFLPVKFTICEHEADEPEKEAGQRR
nr:helix-turn-helix transcriptional regulator [uncultured Agathobaculum sp.]